MNPTLAQLAYEADITVSTELEKFAELLIQECVRCAEGEWIRNGDTEHNRAVSGVIESIKERFGVEQN